MICKFCGYEWKTKTEDPVSCPKCKRRFDYPSGGLSGNDED